MYSNAIKKKYLKILLNIFMYAFINNLKLNNMTTLMRFSFLELSNSINRKFFAFFGAMLIFIGGLNAQNVSYNLNSIPLLGTDNTAFGFQSLFSNTIGTNNIAIGKNSLYSSNNSGSNIAIGYNSLFSTPRSARNIGVGNHSLYQLVSSADNVAIGDSSLSIYTGLPGVGGNTAIGSRAMINPGGGQKNVALGYNAQIVASFPFTINAVAIGANSIAGISNSIQLGDANVTQIFGGVGTVSKFISGGLQITGGTPAAGKVLTSDAVGNATWQPAGGGGGGTAWDISGNTGTVDGTNFIGTTDAVPLSFRVNNQNAGKIDPSLSNAFFGSNAGTSNSSGIQNTAIGDGALSLSDVADNTAVGYHAMNINKNGIENTAVGSKALSGNLTGNQNTAVGSEALTANQTGDQNTAVGSGALANNIDGPYNSALGFQALTSNTSGERNTAVGYKSLTANSTGNLNTAIGGYSMFQSTTAQNNIAYGYESLHDNISGGNNSAIGFQSLYYNTTGFANHAFGQSALFTNTTGTYNVGVGYASMGFNQAGNYNTGLGDLSDVPNLSVLDNAAAIGSRTIVNASNKMRLGDVNVTEVETQMAYTIVSDGRFKFNINEDDVKGLSFINKLRPVVYNFDTKKFESFLTQSMPDSVRKKYLDRDFSKPTAIRQSGFIAQEVEKAAKEVGYDFNGIIAPVSKDDNYSLAYAQFTVPLVKAVQELSRQNDSLKNEIAEIKAMIIANGPSKSTSGSISIAAGEGAKLFQNAPNPFSKTTIIRYTLPDDAKKAMISITNISGVRLKNFDLKSKGTQSIEINGGQIAAGTYIYSLYVDDNLIDSRQMILTK